MTVKELKALLRGLPGDMLVMTLIDDGLLVTICSENSGVVEVDLNMEEEGISEKVDILFLIGCDCEEALPQGSLNSQPELN